MENRVSYILIGLFVFILGFSTIGFVLWLGKYAQNDAYSFYKVVTQESVSGLNPKAPVKLRGVIVGEVQDIYISTENSEDVVVLIKVKEKTPIKVDTYALINLQGITGLSYIELQGGLNDTAILKTGSEEDNYAVIKTRFSMLTRVDKTLSNIGDKTSIMLDKTSEVMSEKNLQNFELIMKNLAEAASSLDKTLNMIHSKDAQLDKILNSVNKTLNMIHSKDAQLDRVLNTAYDFEVVATEAASEVKKMAKNLEESGVSTLKSMSRASATTSRVMNDLDKKLKDGNLDLDVLVRENLLPVQNDLEDLRTLIVETREWIGELRDSPSDLLFKQSSVELAPNEEDRK